MRVKITALILGSALGLNTAAAGTLEITNCSLADFAYTYSVENSEAGIIQIGIFTIRETAVEYDVTVGVQWVGIDHCGSMICGVEFLTTDADLLVSPLDWQLVDH